MSHDEVIIRGRYARHQPRIGVELCTSSPYLEIDEAWRGSDFNHLELEGHSGATHSDQVGVFKYALQL